jgi:hypothetical protein
MTDDHTAARRAEEKRWALMLAGDCEELGDLFSDYLIYAHSDSSMDDRASYLKALGDGSLIYDTLDCEITEATSEGDCTVLMGTMKADVRRNGKNLRLNSSYATVWVSTIDGPKLLAHKSTPLA